VAAQRKQAATGLDQRVEILEESVAALRERVDDLPF
jgi:uncharacterized protein YceH (UPF0502 family)